MKSYSELRNQLVSSALAGDYEGKAEDCDPYQLDCLLNPRKHPLVIRTGTCSCTEDKVGECVARCPFGAIRPSGKGGVEIEPELCFGCSECIDGCDGKKLAESTEIIPALKAVRASKGPSYALIAPAFLGQFSSDVTPGKLRTAMKRLGFDGMLELALFADILTLREALEFDRSIRTENDFQLTSCCCPMWIGMIRKVYSELMPHVPGSVSPMIAGGRTVKLLYPDATTVFIGPCLAKKAEAREKDLAGAIDFVLTFREVRDIFDALGIDPAAMEESEKDHSSRGGRIYARAGGVSEAVEEALGRLNPQRDVSIRTKHADGVAACREMLGGLLAGKREANFYEGMGCSGGCVGGPRSVTGAEKGTPLVDFYGDCSPYDTPVENPYVVELLRRLGMESIESLLEESKIFTRDL